MTASQLITPALSFAAPLAPPLTPHVTLTTGPIPTSRRSELFSRHAPCSLAEQRALNWLALHACPAQAGRDGAGRRAAGGRWVGGAWQGVGTGAACDVQQGAE